MNEWEWKDLERKEEIAAAEKDQGQSFRATHVKQKDLQVVIDNLFKYHKAFKVQRKNEGSKGNQFNFNYIDINCGSGMNTKLEPPICGSPITAINTCIAHDSMSSRFWLCDQGEAQINELNRFCKNNYSVYRLNRIQTFQQDNAQFLKELSPKLLKENNRNINPLDVYGLLFADPNGIVDHPFEEIYAFLNRFPNVAVAINWGYSASARVHSRSYGWKYPSSSTMRLNCNRKYWYLAKVANRYTMMFGTNHEADNLQPLDYEYSLNGLKTNKKLAEKDASTYVPSQSVCKKGIPA